MSRSKAQTDAPDAPVEEQPITGGSFVRDPTTGKLTRVEHPPEAEPAPAIEDARPTEQEG